MTNIKGWRFSLPLVKRVDKVASNSAFGATWNKHDGMEIHFVIKGSLIWEMQKDRTLASAPGGSFVIIPANSLHRLRGGSGTPSLRIGIIMNPCQIADPESLSPFSEEDAARIITKLSSCALKTTRISKRLEFYLKDIARAMDDFDPDNEDSKLALRLAIAALLLETTKCLDAEESLPRDSNIIAEIRKWIDRHACEHIPSERLINLSGYGRSRFFSLFMSEIGMTPNDYIVRLRIQRAKELLVHDHQTGTREIALRCGFGTPSSFAATFRKYTRMTPLEFRKRSLSKG